MEMTTKIFPQPRVEGTGVYTMYYTPAIFLWSSNLFYLGYLGIIPAIN